MAGNAGYPCMPRSRSVPGILAIGTSMPRGAHHAKTTTLAYHHETPVDRKVAPASLEEIRQLVDSMKDPKWRSHTASRSSGSIREEKPPTIEDIVPKNMRHPRLAPAWLKHEKQVLRFYGFFQEHVTESAEENARYRNVRIMFYMEDGTMSVTEPKVENSGIWQGNLLKRHRVPKPDDSGFYGPDDLRVGEMIDLYSRVYRITGADRFTRWFYKENGVELEEDEPMMQDRWQKSYKFKKTAEKGGVPETRAAMEAKEIGKASAGLPPTDHKLQQFLLNDRKVLRFRGYWDDHTLYGARVYFVVHYYLKDNTVEINEAHCRNSGRSNWPLFMKKGPLFKKNTTGCYPGMLAADGDLYLPEDCMVGGSINVWGRKVVLYECDDFTQKFYEDFLGIDQMASRIDVSERPLVHRKLHPPPHIAPGVPEDSVLSCQYLVPKQVKVDLAKLFTFSGEILRFECKMVNGEPEDECRRLVIAFYPQDDNTAVFEMPQRNSGHMGGKFADKRKIMNPATGKYFALSDFYIGNTVTIAAQPLHIIRADERCLQFLEARPEEYPMADPYACAAKLAPLAGTPEMRDAAGIDPDRLKEMCEEADLPIADHEVVTLLRNFSVDHETPMLSGPRMMEVMGIESPAVHFKEEPAEPSARMAVPFAHGGA